MRKIIFTLIIICTTLGISYSAGSDCCGLGAPSNIVFCPRGTPATIDGDASDWGTSWLQMDQQPTSNSTSGMTAKFQMEYDQSNLYIITIINDDTPGDTSIPNSYERDCFEIMMSMDTTSSGGMTGMFQFRRVYGWDGVLGQPGGDSGITDGTMYGSDPSIPASWNGNSHFKVKEIIDGNMYTQEWQLPWDSLSVRMSPPWDISQFRLEVQASDNTKNAAGGRTQQRFWYGNSNSAWNNSYYQQVVLLDTRCGFNSLIESNDLDINAIDNNLKLSRNVSELRIYNSSGNLVLIANNTSSANVSTLKKGLYIARAEGRSYKFIR
jgi:hypothetical protein